MKSNPLIALVALLLVTFLSAGLNAQFEENFESATPSWKRQDTDCVIQKPNWKQRRSNNIETKNRFEKIQFQCGAGTQILVAHDVPPSFVIPEFTPSVRIKSSRAGIRFLVRVVFPHTLAPTGEGPMTTLLPGPVYNDTGNWQTLKFDDEPKDLKEQLKKESWMLRKKFGPQVDARDAYIDKVVLNLYSGAGDSSIQIDDLKVSGIVSAESIAKQVKTAGVIRDSHPTIHDPNFQLSSLQQQTNHRPSLVQRDGTVLLVKKKPFFPRIVQHNGEALNFLKAIGFNTVELSNTASQEQLKEAEELDMWIICPPPKSVGLSAMGFQFDRVLAWNVGDQLTGRELTIIQQRVREIRESDQRTGRPIIGHAKTHWTQICQLTDVLGVGIEPIGTSFFASQYSDWIRQRVVATGNGKPVWADIQTELAESLTSQISTLAKQIPPIPVEPQQIKFLTYEAITGGARGLRFLSRSRLDSPDPVTRLRSQTIEWMNAELMQIEPWAVGGAWMGEVKTNDPQLEVTAINTNRSRLLLIQRPTHHEQYLAGDVPIKTVSFMDPNTTFANRVYQLGETGLVALSNSKDHAGTRIQLDNCPFATAVIMTEDPLVINKLSDSFNRIGQKSHLQMHREVSQQWLAIMQLINAQMGRLGRSSAEASGAINAAVSSFRIAESMIEGSTPQAAVEHLNKTDERLAFARREIVTEPLGAFQSKTSSPFVAHCSLIPLHWDLASRLSQNEWNPNGLGGGDFENLVHMKASGWVNRKIEDDFLGTKVELTKNAAVDGAFGLKLSVFAKQAIPQLVDAPPLWISTPEIPIKGGQLVRIHGWVNIPSVIEGTHDGLMITDSLGGSDLSERVTVTQGWQEFTLYRGTASNGTMNVTFSLGGVGVALLDEVTVRTIDLPPATPRQARR